MVSPDENKLTCLVLVKIDDNANGLIGFNNVSLSDFGIRHWLSKYNRKTESMMRVLGTVQYIAPEVFQDGVDALTPASDIWAIGCIGYELFTGNSLFDSEEMVERYVNNTATYLDPFQRSKLQEVPKMKEILSGCLHPIPLYRWTIWRLIEQLGPSPMA
jgi:eukaryotic-like serine/threonine-protein kinase